MELSMLIPQPEHVAAVLLHTLWQGAVCALLVFLLLRRVPAGRPNLRHGIAVLGLSCIVAGALVTSCALSYVAETGFSSAEGASPAGAEISGREAGTTIDEGGRDGGTTSDESGQAQTAIPPRPVRGIFVYIIRLWLAGVAVMLIRLGSLLAGARQLRKRCRALADPALERLAAEVRAGIGLARRVAILVCDEIAAPVAMGLLWPAVLIPASMAAGLPPDHLRAILAHELAHIRRYDYLVNFLQLVVESLLYFNPAVWWISRQIRIEREACCDALAAKATGGALDYAEALTQAAGRMLYGGPAFAAAQGFGESRRHLLERVRRLMMPGYCPALRLRWYTLAGGAAMSAALFFGMYQGAALGVVLAGRMFRDAERVAALRQLGREYYLPQSLAKDEEEVRISCALLPFDDKLLENAEASVAVIAGSSYTRKAWTVHNNVFSGTVPRGDVYVIAVVPGYAPAALGPLNPGALENLQLPLDPAYPVTIRFIDQDGQPVQGVKAKGSYLFGKNASGFTVCDPSNEQGELTFNQAETPLPVSLEAEAPGVQTARRTDIVLQPEEVYEWVLEPEALMTGLVVDRATGAPLAGAEVGLVFQPGYGFVGACHGEAKPLAVTDDTGRFTVHGLSSTGYYFLARAPGYGAELFRHVPQRDPDPRIELAPRYVSGTIHGDLDLLKRDKAGNPVLSSSMPIFLPAESQSFGGEDHDTPVSVENGVGFFRIDGLRAGTLYIDAGGDHVQVDVDEPVEDLEIVLATPSTVDRKLIVKLIPPDNADPVSGSIEIERSESRRADVTVDVVNGIAETTIEAPAKVRINVNNVPGYVATPPEGPGQALVGKTWSIDAADAPCIIELPLVRAGAIYGRVVMADGSPADISNVEVQIRWKDGSVQPAGFFSPGHTARKDTGEFAVMPLPLGNTFTVHAYAGIAAPTKEVQLTEAAPVAHITMKVPKSTDVSVLVLQPDGRPAPATPVALRWEGHGHEGLRTDADGVCVLRNVPTGMAYTVRAEPTEYFQAAEIPLAIGGENVIRLKNGLAAEGVVLLAGTDVPVSGCTVNARPHLSPITSPLTSITDTQGRFKFTNLSPGSYDLTLEESWKYTLDTPEDVVAFTAGQADDIVVRVRPRETGDK